MLKGDLKCQCLRDAETHNAGVRDQRNDYAARDRAAKRLLPRRIEVCLGQLAVWALAAGMIV